MFKVCMVTLTAFCAALLGHSTNAQFDSGDLDALNYALTLEHLEYAFYRDGLNRFGSSNETATNGTTNATETDPQIWSRLQDIRDHEKAHVDVLTAAITRLGGNPVKECVYNFGYNDSASFLSVARILENVGVAAYDGAAFSVQNVLLRTAAATIATVEARHASYLNLVHNLNPFPTAFDSPLDQQSVVTLASQFIENCTDGGLAVTPFPRLEASPILVSRGETFNVTSSAIVPQDEGSNSSSDLWCVFYTSSSSSNSTLQTDASNNSSSPSYFCRVPEDAVQGDNFLFLSSKSVYTVDDPSSVVAGPTIVYVNATTSSSNGTST